MMNFILGMVTAYFTFGMMVVLLTGFSEIKRGSFKKWRPLKVLYNVVRILILWFPLLIIESGLF